MPSSLRDVIIVGGGISAHTAAVYTARASLKPLVITGEKLDQLSYTTSVENFPGFPDGVQGPDLVASARKQAEKFGAEYVSGRVTKIVKASKGYEVTTSEDKKFLARTIILCTGADARMTGIPGEWDYFGKGVSTCAVCDAALYRNKTAVVVGGGDSAMEESLALYKFAKKIYIVHRRNEFKASKIMQERVLALKDKIEVIWDSIPTQVLGEKFVKSVKIKNLKTNKEREIPTDGFFLAIGHSPNTDFLKGFVDLDEHGFIRVKSVSTSQPGVFAAGDVMDPRYKQAITSAGSGCKAALEAEWFIEHLKAEKKY